jgi:hypothetical protein
MIALQRSWYVLVLTVLMAACTTVTPQSSAQRFAQVDGQLTAVIETVADLRAGGVLDDGTFTDLKTQLHEASDAMDAAWVALGAGDISTQEAKLALATKILYTVRGRVAAAQGAQP